ncbi:MAG: Mur ligase family protein [Alphaproteobacteria bacterium]|nr:Mur ligase family protein [Alphaproteobacteria bacterium]
MKNKDSLFFCAVGGSGMLPLAMMMRARGFDVAGSDRAHDQGRTPERFALIRDYGITLFPQNGSGITEKTGRVVVSTAVEKTVPDYQAALRHHIPIVHRAALLAEIFNAAHIRIAVAGTSGKSTTTGMIGFLLHKAGANPTVVNGAVMKDLVTPESPIASAVVGDPELFIAEVDESDGSIENFTPSIAVLNNIALDHKSMDELRELFSTFLGKAAHCVVNLDNTETAALAATCSDKTRITYSLTDPAATLIASAAQFQPNQMSFTVTHTPTGAQADVTLYVTGYHNISNALAALGAALAFGLTLETAAQALTGFTGITRRLDVLGSAQGITVIDDFAHNPDKIAATLRTLHQFEGRLLILFQPHGYGPLRLMREDLIACFANGLTEQDELFLCDPLYLGGTTSREVGSADIVAGVIRKGRKATHKPTREEAAACLIRMAQKGDRIVIMGARDDTLPKLGREILFHLEARG